MVSLSVLIKDSVNVLIGVPSRTFHLDKVLLVLVSTLAVSQMNDKETILPTTLRAEALRYLCRKIEGPLLAGYLPT